MRISLLTFVAWVLGATVTLGAPAQSLQDVLSQAQAYDFGQDRKAVVQLEQMVARANPQEHRAMEKELLKALEATPSPGLRDVLCRQLSLIGSEEAVPVLIAMLKNEQSMDPARYALERIGGPLVDRQLRLLLPSVGDPIKVGIVTTQAVRRDAEAVPMIGPLLKSSNVTLATAAAAALGNIGTPEAVKILATTQDDVAEPVRSRVMDAQLQGANRMMSAGQADAALAVYARLLGSSYPTTIRAAAWRQQAIVQTDQLGHHILKVIQSGDADLLPMALASVRRVKDPVQLKSIAATLSRLNPPQQVVLLAALADAGNPVVLPAIGECIKSPQAQVRMAVFRALGQMGHAEQVATLVAAAAREEEPVRSVAREALYGLRGDGIDLRLVDALPAAAAPEQVEIILAISERRVAGAAPVLMTLAASEERVVQRDACQALIKVARWQDVPALVDLLCRQPTKLHEDVLVGALLRFGHHADRMQPVMAVLERLDVTGATRAALLRVLGRVGDASGLAVIQGTLQSDDVDMQTEAIRALSLWPTPEPKERLFTLAENEQPMNRHVLALRGFITMAVLPDAQTSPQAVSDLARAWDLARRDDEKRMILSALPKVACQEALSFAEQQRQEAALLGEVQNAMVSLGQALARAYPQQVRKVLQSVVAEAASPAVQKRAQDSLAQMK
jgi:HEAT repeat protein